MMLLPALAAFSFPRTPLMEIGGLLFSQSSYLVNVMPSYHQGKGTSWAFASKGRSEREKALENGLPTYLTFLNRCQRFEGGLGIKSQVIVAVCFEF